MIIDIFNEIPWQAFQNLEFIKKLPLNEQKEKYDKYISELSLAKDFELQYQVKGPRSGNNLPACSAGMDVIFCIDYSGSMGSAIDAIKTDVTNIVNTIIAESGDDYRLGLVLFDAYRSTQTPQPGYTDYSTKIAYTSLPTSQKIITPYTTPGPNSGYGTNPPATPPYFDVYQALTTVEMMSTKNQASFDTILQKLNTTDFPIGGGAISQAPEPGDLAIEEIINNDFAGAFRSNVAKLIITISDNYPGGNAEDYDADVISRLQTLVTTSTSQQIQHLVMLKMDLNQNLNPKIMAPNTGYRILSDNTNGEFVNDFAPANIITTIENICVENA